jgi:hypothetical protein
MAIFNITVTNDLDVNFLFSGSDAEMSFSRVPDPTINIFLGDSINFTFLTTPIHLFEIVNTDFKNRYSDNSPSTWTPTVAQTYVYRAVDFPNEMFGYIIVNPQPTTTTTTTTTTSTTTTSTTTTSTTTTTSAPTPRFSFAGFFSTGGFISTEYGSSGLGFENNQYSVFLGGNDNNDNRLWIRINQTGTLRGTLSISSQISADYGYLYKTVNSPSSTLSLNGLSQLIGRSGEGTFDLDEIEVLSGEYLVLRYTKDNNFGAGSDRVQINLFIIPKEPTTTTTTPEPCPCGELFIPAGSVFSQSGISLNVLYQDEIVNYDLVHQQNTNLGLGQLFQTATNIKNIDTPKIIDGFNIVSNNSNFTNQIARNNLSIIIKDGNDSKILSKHYFGNAFTNYQLPELLMKPASNDISISGVHNFILEFYSICDAGINPCKDFLPQDIFVLRYPYLCIPVDQQDPPYQELEIITSTTTTTTTVPPDIFKIHPQNISAIYLNKFTLSFLVHNLSSEYIIYHWEKSVDNGVSWMQISPAIYGEVNKLQEISIVPNRNMNIVNKTLKNELYRVVLEYPTLITSNYGTVSIQE